MPRYMPLVDSRQDKEEKKEVKGMVSLKMTEKEAKKQQPSTSIEKADLPKYPYGFSLHFDSDQLDKFPQLKGLDVGAKVEIKATGEIVSTNERQRQGGKKQSSVEIQLEAIGVSKK